MSSLVPVSSLNKYIQDIKEMYPDTNTARFRAIFKLSDDWESDRAIAAESAFATVKQLISEKKLKFGDDSSSDHDSESDDNDDKEWRIKKITKKFGDYEKKFVTSQPTCSTIFFAFD